MGRKSFMLGGSVKGGKILGEYPSELREGDTEGRILSRGRIIPKFPWDAMLQGVAEWFGMNTTDLDTVLPMRNNFPAELLYNSADLFIG